MERFLCHHFDITLMEEAIIFPIYERIEKFKKLGSLKETGPVLAFIHIYLREKTGGKGKVVIKNVARELAKEAIVEEVHIVAGECDIILKVRAKSVFELGQFVAGKLRTIKGIEKTVTSIVLESVKE
ncbi:Lrp/AsnC family transcriptional regulator [Nanoarchaeota archaeon]|nr:MAG: Lrp/AsnC family transcriptional regulator [Nanoarchaeota archaeon]